jgi:hypothetical protein
MNTLFPACWPLTISASIELFWKPRTTSRVPLHEGAAHYEAFAPQSFRIRGKWDRCLHCRKGVSLGIEINMLNCSNY